MSMLTRSLAMLCLGLVSMQLTAGIPACPQSICATSSSCATNVGYNFVDCSGNAPGSDCHGTDESDCIWGSEGTDFIYAGKGADVVCGNGGDDVIKGGLGADRLCGGSGADVVEGGWGDDQLWGDSEDDTLDGGKCYDQIFGGDGTDECYEGQGSGFIEDCEVEDLGKQDSQNYPTTPKCDPQYPAG